MDRDAVVDALERFPVRGELIQSPLDPDEEAVLREKVAQAGRG